MAEKTAGDLIRAALAGGKPIRELARDLADDGGDVEEWRRAIYRYEEGGEPEQPKADRISSYFGESVRTPDRRVERRLPQELEFAILKAVRESIAFALSGRESHPDDVAPGDQWWMLDRFLQESGAKAASVVRAEADRLERLIERIEELAPLVRADSSQGSRSEVSPEDRPSAPKPGAETDVPH